MQSASLDTNKKQTSRSSMLISKSVLDGLRGGLGMDVCERRVRIEKASRLPGGQPGQKIQGIQDPD